jgi:hypothetical protein
MFNGHVYYVILFDGDKWVVDLSKNVMFCNCTKCNEADERSISHRDSFGLPYHTHYSLQNFAVASNSKRHLF